MSVKYNAGWGYPQASKHYHFFCEGQMRSICGSYIYTGLREDRDKNEGGNCRKCKEKIAALLAKS